MRTRTRCTRVTALDLIGLPRNDSPTWRAGHSEMRIALALCDAFAALHRTL